jgi:hypothetical protein
VLFFSKSFIIIPFCLKELKKVWLTVVDSIIRCIISQRKNFVTNFTFQALKEYP